MELHEHPELKEVLRGQTRSENDELETKLIREGIRDPLVLWNHDGKDYIVDGHNRYEIATRRDLDFMVEYKAFDDVEQAHDWIIDNQLGRRNLTPEQYSILRGKKYNRLKDRPGGYYGNQYTREANAQIEQKPDTAEKVASEHGVSRATVVRDAEFARALDALVEVGGDEVESAAVSANLIGKSAAVALKKKLGTDTDGVIEVLRRVTVNGEKASTVMKELFPPKEPPKPRDVPARPPAEPTSKAATEDSEPTPPPDNPTGLDSWSDDERKAYRQLINGQTVVLNMSKDGHPNLIEWAKRSGLFVRIDRETEWGNPFETPNDGDLTAVAYKFEDHYLPHKPRLLEKLPELEGKALGCWCAPEICHGHVLAGLESW